MKLFTLEEINSLISRFEKRQLPKTEWTHEAHIVVAFWYNSNYAFEEAMNLVRKNITLHNESVGTVNSESDGYHETITKFWMITVANFIHHHKNLTIENQFKLFIQSPLAKSSYPLTFYSDKYLFSIEARFNWLDPDLKLLNLI